MPEQNFARALQILQQTFGYKSFRPAQETVVKSLLEGRETVAVMPTGAGKSICFQVPARPSDSKPTSSNPCCKSRPFPSSPSTRRTACRSGDTTFAQAIAPSRPSSNVCRSVP